MALVDDFLRRRRSFLQQSYAGTDKSKGNAYDEKTDKRSWEHLMVFFKEVIGK